MLKLGFLLVVLAVAITLARSHEPFHVKFQWNYINYTWPSAEIYSKAKENGSYIERHNVISGIKVYKDRIYLTIPRRKSGIPATLASIPIKPIDGDTAPLLEPYPNWNAQKVGDCSALQFVQNVEIDPKGRMWVLDTGRAKRGSTLYKCPPSLIILDLENNGKVLKRYPLPYDVASPETGYLYDIVLEHEDGGVAYISDADPKKSGIVVFSLQNGTFWKMSHSSTAADEDAVGFSVDDVRVEHSFNVHGLALSPASSEGHRTLYYSPLSSYHLYSISTSVLKNETLRDDVNPHVVDLGRKSSQTDGMTMTNTGVLYFSLLAEDSIAVWGTRYAPFASGQRIITRDHYLLQWQSSISVGNGQVWAVTNRLQRFLDDSISIKEQNFRLIAASVDYGNYQYLENGKAPLLPEIERSRWNSNCTDFYIYRQTL